MSESAEKQIERLTAENNILRLFYDYIISKGDARCRLQKLTEDKNELSLEELKCMQTWRSLSSKNQNRLNFLQGKEVKDDDQA